MDDAYLDDATLDGMMPDTVRAFVESTAWRGKWTRPESAPTIYIWYKEWAKGPLSQRAFAHALRAEWRLPDRRVQAYVMYPSRPPLYIPAPAWREAAQPAKVCVL